MPVPPIFQRGQRISLETFLKPINGHRMPGDERPGVSLLHGIPLLEISQELVFGSAALSRGRHRCCHSKGHSKDGADDDLLGVYQIPLLLSTCAQKQWRKTLMVPLIAPNLQSKTRRKCRIHKTKLTNQQRAFYLSGRGEKLDHGRYSETRASCIAASSTEAASTRLWPLTNTRPLIAPSSAKRGCTSTPLKLLTRLSRCQCQLQDF